MGTRGNLTNNYIDDHESNVIIPIQYDYSKKEMTMIQDGGCFLAQEQLYNFVSNILMGSHVPYI